MKNKNKAPFKGKVYTPQALLDAKKAFCITLQKRRLELGLSQKQVSSDLTINLAQVYKDENGDNNITLSRLLKYMHYYAISFKM